MLDKLKSLRPRATADWLMIAAFAGLAFIAPVGAAKIILAFIKDSSEDKEYSKVTSKLTTRQISRAIYDLKRRKIIRFKQEGTKILIALTEKGLKRKLKFDLDNIKIIKQPEWDGKWRMLMFDIPEDMKSFRDAFSLKLKNIGFLQFQKSVWVCPYPCKNEIDFITEYFHIAPYVSLLMVIIEDDLPLRSKFSL